MRRVLVALGGLLKVESDKGCCLIIGRQGWATRRATLTTFGVPSQEAVDF